MSKQRRTFSAEFKREAAALVLDQGYSHIDACRSLGLQVMLRIFPTRNRKYLIYIFPGRFLTWRNIESLATLAVRNEKKLSRLEP
ncbi:hypothetical protein IPC1259_20470 [Pseudomonas aeruginosa]|nr:hypothetical protein IPC1259_20470 [Pseudomonas aeruginosa]